MAVYEYTAVHHENKAETAEGTIVARNKIHAMDMLTRRGLVNPRFKQLSGLTAFFRQMTADIR